MSYGFTKLWGGLVTSSLWCQDDKVLRVWIAMLATCDGKGMVEGSIPGFASLARVTPDDLRRALDLLMSPDPDSRTTENEGRRIEKVHGGWKILNYLAYRAKGQEKDGSRAEYFREYRKRHVAQCSAQQPNVARTQEAEAEAEAESKKTIASAIASASMGEPIPATATAAPKGTKKQPKPAGRTKRAAKLALPLLEMTPAEAQAFERVWTAWPAEGWNYSTRSTAPRRINQSKAAERFLEICRNAPISVAGDRLTPDDLAQSALEYLDRRKAEASPQTNGFPNVACIANFFSSDPASKTPWKDALVEFFGVTP